MTPTTEALAPAYRPTEEEKLWAVAAHVLPAVALFYRYPLAIRLIPE